MPRQTRQATTSFPLHDIDLIAAAIRIPLDRWAGDCHGIAMAVMKRFPVYDSSLARGIWNGEINRKSIFHGRPFSAHTWIRLGDGRVLDPTRFAFTGEEPRIYLGLSDHYDEAGFEARRHTPPPLPGDRTIKVTRGQAKVLSVPGLAPITGHISLPEIHWLAHLAPAAGRDLPAIFSTIGGLGYRSLIPIDAYKLIMQPGVLLAETDKLGWYSLPEAAQISDTRALSMIVDRFLHPDRNGKVWDWAEEEDGHGLLEVMSPMDALRNLGDQPIEKMRRDDADFLCQISMEFLGSGNADSVEQYARSLGVRDISPLLSRLGNHAGITYRW